ncbi:MAG: histidine phosphatase family protein [Nanoarchaeota archaeon]|nr:histidine phosphatase family protein [Nanoarchaeota archaeon]
MKLLVVRHNQSKGNVANVIDDNSNPKRDKNGLSEKGINESKELVKILESHKIDTVIVSPFRRTIETVQPYLNKHKVKLIVSDLTSERNAGIFAGKPKTAIKEYCIADNITDRVSFKPKGGESIFEVYERAKKFIAYLKKNFKNETILLCGHVNFLCCLDIAIKKLEIHDFYNQERLENGQLREYIL